LPYFQITNETVFSKQLIEMLLADIIFKISSFRAFADAYNFLNASNFKNRNIMEERRLSEVFYIYEFLKYKSEFNLPEAIESNILIIKFTNNNI
jgi:hypothetical protein